jgi:cell division protein FtsB
MNLSKLLKKIKLPQANASLFANVVGVVIAVYLCVILVQTVKTNYGLDKQISGLQTQIATLQANNDQLNFNLKYYATASYQQKEARAELGLLAPGENEIILPTPSAAPTPSDATTTKTPKKSNLQQWSDFLHGRSSG